MLPIVIKVLLVIHVLVSLLIILLVLMQRPKNEGLGAAFGGGATDQLFGAQTTNVLQTITRWLGGIFFVLTLLLSILYVKQGGGRSSVQDKLTAPTVIPSATSGSDQTPEQAVKKAIEDAMSGKTKPADQPAADGTSILDGNEPLKIEMAPGKAGEAVTEPVKPELPAVPLEKIPEKNAPAPLPAPAVPPAAEKKPVEPAPEPKPAEPAK